MEHRILTNLSKHLLFWKSQKVKHHVNYYVLTNGNLLQNTVTD